MISAKCFAEEIKLLWSERKEKTESMKYRVSVGDIILYTDKTCHKFQSLKEDTEYEFTVDLVQEWTEIVGKSEICRAKTKRKWEIIDLTKPPYNVVGDGITDNTKAIQQAIIDCTNQNRVLFFPKGMYLYKEIQCNSSIRMRFDEGATVCRVKARKKN